MCPITLNMKKINQMEKEKAINWAKDFESIKEGEHVLIEVGVFWGWNMRRFFYVAKKIIRTTKTQFTIEQGKRFYKKSGCLIGDIFPPAHIYSIKNNDITDQTKEYLAFKERINLEKLIISKIDTIIFKPNTSIEIKDLKNFLAVLEDIKTKLGK